MPVRQAVKVPPRTARAPRFDTSLTVTLGDQQRPAGLVEADRGAVRRCLGATPHGERLLRCARSIWSASIAAGSIRRPMAVRSWRNWPDAINCLTLCGVTPSVRAASAGDSQSFAKVAFAMIFSLAYMQAVMKGFC